MVGGASCPSTSARRSGRRRRAGRRAGARRPRTRRRRASAGRAGRPPAARCRTSPHTLLAAAARSTLPALGREHRLEQVQVHAGRRRSPRPCVASRRGATQRASASSRLPRSTGLTRYSAAPSANPAPRSSIIETITTGIADVAGSLLSCGEQLPAVESRQQDVEDHGRRARARARQVEPLDAVARDRHGVTGVLEVDAQQVGRAAVVLDDEDAAGVGAAR